MPVEAVDDQKKRKKETVRGLYPAQSVCIPGQVTGPLRDRDYTRFVLVFAPRSSLFNFTETSISSPLPPSYVFIFTSSFSVLISSAFVQFTTGLCTN